MSFDCEVDCPEHDLFVQSTVDLTGIYIRRVLVYSAIILEINPPFISELLKNVNLHSDALLKIVVSFNQYPTFVSSRDSSVQSLYSQIIANLVNEVTKLKDTTR
jgi:hypothetical protein